MQPCRIAFGALLVALSECSALQLSAARALSSARVLSRCAAPLLSATPDKPEQDDEQTYSVDWDSAWKKEVGAREEGTQSWRPEGYEPPTDQVRLSKLFFLTYFFLTCSLFRTAAGAA